MIEFFSNLWQGILNNKDAIIVALTSAEFVGLAAAIVNLVKGTKNTSANTLSNNALSATIEKGFASIVDSNESLKIDLSKAVEENKALSEKVEVLTNELAATKHELSLLTETDNLLLFKLNSILEVQALAYSTLKDVNTRNAILSTLATAKHSETTHMSDIKAQLEAMRNEITEKVNDVNAAVKQTVEKAENIISVVDNAKVIADNAFNADVHKTVVTRG